MANKHIVDKVTDDDSKIVMSSKSIKWILGILLGATTSILGFAWGLYIKTDTKIDIKYAEFQEQIKESEMAIIKKMEEIEKEKVKPNSDKNYAQDMDIVRLYERTNSKGLVINGDHPMPEIISNTGSVPEGLPTIGE